MMSEQPLVRWLTGSKSITRKDRCSARRQCSHETRVETSLTESFGGCWPTNALWPVSWPWSDFLSTPCSYLLPGLLIWQGSAPWHVGDLMCSFPGRPSLFFQCLCSAWLNISDFSFRTGSTYADTSSALPCRIMTFPLNSNNLDDGTQLRLSPSHQRAKESHQYLNRNGHPSKAYQFSPSISVSTDFRRKSKGLSWSLQSCSWNLQPNNKTITSTPNYQYTAVFCVWSPFL